MVLIIKQNGRLIFQIGSAKRDPTGINEKWLGRLSHTLPVERSSSVKVGEKLAKSWTKKKCRLAIRSAMKAAKNALLICLCSMNFRVKTGSFERSPDTGAHVPPLSPMIPTFAPWRQDGGGTSRLGCVADNIPSFDSPRLTDQDIWFRSTTAHKPFMRKTAAGRKAINAIVCQ